MQSVNTVCLDFPSVQFSHSVVSDSLWSHGLQHTRLPCPSPTPGACSNSCPSSWWCPPTISSSAFLLVVCVQLAWHMAFSFECSVIDVLVGVCSPLSHSRKPTGHAGDSNHVGELILNLLWFIENISFKNINILTITGRIPFDRPTTECNLVGCHCNLVDYCSWKVRNLGFKNVTFSPGTKLNLLSVSGVLHPPWD